MNAQQVRNSRNQGDWFLSHKGEGVPKDMQKAREWINKLSAKGDGRDKIWLEKH